MIEPNTAPQVFVSYASDDKAVADSVCRSLESAGVRCWIAPRDIPPGTDYPAAIVEAIRSVRVLVLILTGHAAASPHILSEVGHAFNGKKPIIPFRLSSDALPNDLEYFLSMTQWLDAPEGSTEENLKRLTQATLDALAGERKALLPVQVKGRRGLILAAGTLLLLAAGILAYRKWERLPGPSPAPGLSSPATSTAAAPPTTIPPAATNTAATPTTSTPKRKTWVNPADRLTYVWIPPGTFTMGCSVADSECKDDEKPTHPVAIDKGFWLGQTEVTVSAWRPFAAKHGLEPPTGDADLPVIDVNRQQAKDYCAATGGRLPTEAEWEYAARGGNPQAYYGVISAIAWYAKNSGNAPHPVGKKQPNAFGLYDMLGNVAEWVFDRYYDKYDLDADATGPGVEEPVAPNSFAVARGGFWQSEATSLRVSRRSPWLRDGADIPVGFRCARNRP